MVKKKDGAGNVIGHRFCLDLTGVNNVTTKDAYTLPLISRTKEKLGGAKFFAKGDLDQAFWQINIRERDKQKLSFVVDGLLFEPNVMPFGATNAPGTFQRLMDRVLKGLNWKQCLVYLDDILIYSMTFEEHLRHTHEILSRFCFANLRLKPSKCKFGMQEVDFLGFRVTAEGMSATEKKIEAMLRVEPPVTTKNLFSFLCSINYYRKHIPRYGELTEGLYKMCE